MLSRIHRYLLQSLLRSATMSLPNTGGEKVGGDVLMGGSQRSSICLGPRRKRATNTGAWSYEGGGGFLSLGLGRAQAPILSTDVVLCLSGFQK